MKKLLGLIFLMLILVSATEFSANKTDTMHSIEGTWELQSFYNYDGEAITDTVLPHTNYRQVKVYTGGKIMWSRYSPQDTIGRFGYGSYKLDGNQLIETIEYGDYQMMRALDTMRVFSFELMLSNDTYSQISWDEEGNRTFSENYARVN
ncbi:hypothetical protein [Maribacter antarcticus]|uniref:hypothetical protein n=1 Tax=Maribacter antarcticus TaxID=505250 RepID=UPI0004799DE1|nr:hypothetical protein [Maribacter antarcticus]